MFFSHDHSFSAGKQIASALPNVTIESYRLLRDGRVNGATVLAGFATSLVLSQSRLVQIKHRTSSHVSLFAGLA
jgi:hypothetical protein